MKNTFFVFGCVSFFIAGCSPKVTTEVVKSYPVTRAYDVRLFEAKDTLPPAAEVLGRASVEKGRKVMLRPWSRWRRPRWAATLLP